MSAELLALGLSPFFTQQLSLEEMEVTRLVRVFQVQRSLLVVGDGSASWTVALGGNWSQLPSEARATVGERGPPAPPTAAVPPTRPQDPRLTPGWCPRPLSTPGTPQSQPDLNSPPPHTPGGAASATHDRWGLTAAESQAATWGAREWADGPSSVSASAVGKAPAEPPSRRQPRTGSPGARRAGL